MFVLSTDYFQDFFKNKEGYIQTQVGNPDGPDKPNKKVNAILFSYGTHSDEKSTVLRPSSLGSRRREDPLSACEGGVHRFGQCQ
jgi:hypothetical protein